MTSTLSQQSFTDAAGSADAWLGAARLTFRQGEEIYAQDEDADLIYRLVRGAVRTSHLLADGRRQIGDFYYVGDVNGVEIGATHRYSAEALGDCEVLAMRRSGSAAYDAGRLDRMIWQATTAELGRAQSHMLLLGRAPTNSTRPSACSRLSIREIVSIVRPR